MTDVPAEGDIPNNGPTGTSPATPNPAPADGHAAATGQSTAPANGSSTASSSGPFNPPSGEIRLGGGDLVAVTPPPADVKTPGAQRPPEAGKPRARVKGRIDIADEVVEKVTAAAAYEVEGVADLGGNVQSALEMMRQRIGIGRKKEDQARVNTEIDGGEAEIDVAITIKYGYSIVDVARRVQVNVAHQSHVMLGLKVIAVNVTVDDIELPEDALSYKDEDESTGYIITT